VRPVENKEVGRRWYAPQVSQQLHVHTLPTDDELRQLVGAATPHFSPQIRERLAALAASLPPDDSRQVWLSAQIERMTRLGRDGEYGDASVPDLPSRAPLADR
jgi:hypothetical protein